VDGLEISTFEPVFVAKDSSYAIFPKHPSMGYDKVAIRQGCVLYPVEYSYAGPVRNLLFDGVAVLNVPIGDVSITASRESLSFDEHTKEYVTTLMKETAVRIQEEVAEELSKCKNRLEALRFWYSGGNVFNFKPKYRDEILNDMVLFKGGGDWEPPVVRYKKETKPRRLDKVTFSHIHEATFVTHYPKVRPVKRAIKRYKSFVDKSAYNAPVVLLENPTPRQLERLTTLCGLRKDQVVWVGNLDDPGPNTKKASSSSHLPGVNRILNSMTWDRIQSLDDWDDYLWVVTDRITQSEAGYALRRFREAVEL